MSALLKFWGTRGSIPTPGSWTRVYGGNTSCVEVRFGDSVFICDAGSGIRQLGRDLLERDPLPNDLHLFITHTHWDHIQGFPFFAPAHLKNFRIFLYGTDEGDTSRYRLISGQMTSSYFPVDFGDLMAEVIPDTIHEGHKVIDGVKVTCFPTNHPGGCFGYRFDKDEVSVAYVTDNEMPVQPEDTFPDPDNKGPLRKVPEQLLAAVKGVDLLVVDSQYDDAQYATKVGWGHSSCFTSTDLGIQAGAKALALFHHDPECTDEEIDAKVETCRKRAENFKSEMVVFAAREGVELKL
jgi:phosphoribosyl 1,2-cyclic phosphodiesterase